MYIQFIGLMLGAYVLGAFPFVYLLGRLSGVDLRVEGSQNVGGTNLFRTVGPFTGVVGALLDIGKGLLPVLAARALDFNEGVAGLAAIAAVTGQCWPIFLRFRGGRGISVVGGAVIASSPLTFVWAILPTVAGLAAYIVMKRRQQQDAAAIFGKDSKDSRSVPLFMMVSVISPAFCGCRTWRDILSSVHVCGALADRHLAPFDCWTAPRPRLHNPALYTLAQPVSL